MKKLNYFLVIGSVALFTSCGQGNTSSKENNVTDVNAEKGTNSIVGQLYLGSGGQDSRRYLGFYFITDSTCFK